MDNQLTPIQEREKHFHDLWAQEIKLEDLMVHEAFESPTAAENRFALKSMGDLKGKKLLDLGCGAGETSVYFALQGADVTAVDISPKMVETAGRLAEKFGVRLRTHAGPAESLPFPNNEFDIVFGNGVLHHVDIPETIKEIHRVLKSKGKGFFIEPLPYNPVIKMYRKMASNVRTCDEKPFRFPLLKLFRKTFSKVSHQEFWLFSLLIFIIFYLKGSHPGKERYWKKIIKEGPRYRRLYGFLETLDRIALKIPLLNYWCWNTVITIQK